MLKKEFIAGMVTGAIAFGGTGAAASGLLAQPSMQSIYVNGRPLYCTAYAISGNNYVRLRDIGQAVGFGVEYDSRTDSVQISTGAQQAVQPAVAMLPITATAPRLTTEAPAQPTVTPSSRNSSRDYSQDANPAIFTADLTREFYNSARHAYLNAGEMAASFDRNLRKADESLAVRLPNGMQVTTKMKNVCHELGGVFYNYEISENLPYVYAFPRNDDDLKRPSVQAIIEKAKDCENDLEKAEFLAEIVCDRLEYAYDRDIDSWNKAMDSGGKAVCSGYAAAFQRMGRAAGLDALTIGSKAGNHAWNLVCCDGEWLTVDLTHYDTSHNEANWFQKEHPKMKPDGLDEINFVKEVLQPGSIK
ncbi:MAG: hypothetical protein HFH26_07330 [Clostridiaceae bacterium]|nr:hypothetical protein [Clostridiaceae bacterium]